MGGCGGLVDGPASAACCCCLCEALPVVSTAYVMGLQVTEVDGSVATGCVNQLKPGLNGALDGGAVAGGAGGTCDASSTSPAFSGEAVDPLRNTRLKKEEDRGVRTSATLPAAVEKVG